MSPLRRLLSIRSRVGAPGTILSLGHSDGALLYLEAAMSPVSVVVALEHADVLQLHGVLAEWLRERADVLTPAPYPLPAGSPLVGGLLGRLVADAGRARTVQNCTVPATAHRADLHEGERPAV